MFSYINCTTLPEFQAALRGQIETWKADLKPHDECHKLLFDYIKAVNSRLYPEQGQAAVGHHGVMDRLQDMLSPQSPYSTAEAYQAVHDILFPVSRDFTSAQLMEIVPLAHYILHLYSEARFVPVPVKRQVADLIDNVLGGGVLDGQLEAMYPLISYTTETEVVGTGLDMDARKKDKELHRALFESSLDTYEDEQMMWAMQDTPGREQADLEEAIRRSIEDRMILDD